ncbi:MAG: AraC family ligand binding domain-containing protein, partial [Planctomycetota bacterium]
MNPDSIPSGDAVGSPESSQSIDHSSPSNGLEANETPEVGSGDLIDSTVKDAARGLEPDRLPTFVSRQVEKGKRFYLNLRPNPDDKLVVVCGGYEQVEPDYEINREELPYYAIELVAGGRGQAIINGRPYDIEAGSVYAYGPQVRHVIKTDPDQPLQKYFIDFFGTDGLPLLTKANLEAWAPRRVGGLHELTGIMEMIIRESTSHRGGVHEICELLL